MLVGSRKFECQTLVLDKAFLESRLYHSNNPLILKRYCCSVKTLGHPSGGQVGGDARTPLDAGAVKAPQVAEVSDTGGDNM